MKRLLCTVISIILAISVMAGGVCFADSDEQIDLDVNLVSRSQYEKLAANTRYTPIDLTPYVNNSTYDDVSGDGKGGWSDQGKNDMRHFNLTGTHEILNVPFTFVAPKAKEDASIIGLRGLNDERLTNKVEIDVNGYAGSAYFIHASPYALAVCGTYSFLYEDGTKASFGIKNGEHIRDHMGIFDDGEFWRTAWTGKSEEKLNLTDSCSLGLFALNNPHPDKKISKLVLETDGGAAYVMIFAITLSNNDAYLPAFDNTLVLNPSQMYWNEAQPQDISKTDKSLLDLSYMLDAPAGKHGAVVAKGENFEFADKTPVKFIGTNIKGKAVFPEKADADKIAAGIAYCGYNLARIQLDNSASITAENAQKLIYLISKFKERGIYTYLTFACDAKYKINGFINKELIAEQQSAMSLLLSAKSEYLNSTLANDPAVAMIEFLGGSSFTDYNGGITNALSGEDFEKIKAEFNTFIAGRYKTDKELKAIWTSDFDFIDNENMADGNFYFGPWKNGLFSQAHKADIGEFLAQKQIQYYNAMSKYVRELGYAGLTVCNSDKGGTANYSDVCSNAEASDFVARSVVTNATLKESGLTLENIYFNENKPALKSSDMGQVVDAASQCVAGKPFVVSEYGTPEPDYYYNETMLTMASAAAQQGWSLIDHYYICDDVIGENEIKDVYSAVNNPARRALMYASSLIYNCVSPLKGATERYIQESAAHSGTGSVGISNADIFNSKNRISFSKDLKYNKTTENEQFVMNDELLWDLNDGVFTVENSGVNVFAGALKQEERLKKLNINLDNDYASVVLSSFDGDLDTAEKYLLITVGSVRNKKEKISTRSVDKAGGAPIMYEPITGVYTLKIKDDLEVYSIGFSGERVQKIPVTKTKEGYAEFRITQENASMYYEIVRKGNGGAAK